MGYERGQRAKDPIPMSRPSPLSQDASQYSFDDESPPASLLVAGESVNGAGGAAAWADDPLGVPPGLGDLVPGVELPHEGPAAGAAPVSSRPPSPRPAAAPVRVDAPPRPRPRRVILSDDDDLPAPPRAMRRPPPPLPQRVARGPPPLQRPRLVMREVARGPDPPAPALPPRGTSLIDMLADAQRRRPRVYPRLSRDERDLSPASPR